MAYRDPYTEQHGRYDQPYTDTPTPFNPYSTQPHQAYDQGGYDPYHEAAGETNYGQSAHPAGSAYAPGQYKSETTGQYQGAFAQAAAGNRPGNFRHWRHEAHAGLWTRGSRASCIGRFCCCTLMIIIFLIISILLPLALWTRPPNITIGSVQTVTNGSEIQALNNGIKINLEIPISVSNPNYFSVSFSSITANIYYPIGNTLIGSGQEGDITFYSNSSRNFTFPFSIEYTTTMSSSAAIITDLVKKCGTQGGSVSDITVNYEITPALRVLFFTVSPTISNSASFRCPLTASDISSLSSALGGSSS